MAFDAGLVEWVTEALEPLGTVTMRRMMGGATLYLDGSIFGIVADSEIWFKPMPRAMRCGTRSAPSASR